MEDYQLGTYQFVHKHHWVAGFTVRRAINFKMAKGIVTAQAHKKISVFF